MKIITSFPGWFFLFCILAGIVVTAVLYYKNPLNDVKPFVNRILSVLRFLSVTLITFLLLSPMVRMSVTKKEKPIIIFAQDNSESIIYNKDSVYYRKQYPSEMRKMLAELEEKYDLREYDFGDGLNKQSSFSYTGKQTDISSVFDEIQTVYANRNVGAVVIASDGLYNKGMNPVYSAAAADVPVYTIALGDTGIYRDVSITGVNYNKITILGNNFPLEVLVSATRADGAESVLNVIHGDETVFTRNVKITGERFFQNINVQLQAKTPGMQRYRVVLSPVQGENNRLNNARDVFVNVLDSRQKILIVAAAPHPDITALKTSIESNDNYKADVLMAGDFNITPGNYGLVVFHQLPSLQFSGKNIVDAVRRNHIPALTILGAQTNLNEFNELKEGVTVSMLKNQTDEALPEMNSNFAMFTLSDEARRVIREFPPLITPYGDYKTFTSATALFYQKIGSVITQKPLIIFNKSEGVVNGVITGEGIWKWRMYNYLKEGNHKVFDELISKIIQYISLKENTGLFRVYVRNVMPENEQAVFDAELYNESFELVNDPEVHLTLTDKDNKKYEFTFGKSGMAYRLNAGYLPHGEYRYLAHVSYGGKKYETTGSFFVAEINAEAVRTVADHNLLYKLSHEKGGRMILPADLAKLPAILAERNDIKPLSYTIKKYAELNNLLILLLLILGMLVAEWFIRKRSGSY